MHIGESEREAVNTTLAVAVWEDRVSTTLDFARRLLIVEIDEGREVYRKEVPLVDEPAAKKARRIRDLSIETVLCGAISQALADAVSQMGIEVIPYVSGQVDDVLAAYLCGRLEDPDYLQPGCRSGARKQWCHRRGF